MFCDVLARQQPSVSVGNVPQLAVDVFLSTLDAEKVGTFLHPAVLPLVGPCALGKPGKLTLGSEVFAVPSKRILFVQFRTPILGNGRPEFLEFFTSWLSGLEPAKVLILSSCYAYEKREVQSSALRFVANSEAKKEFEQLLREKDVKPLLGEDVDVGKISLPGGGFARELLEKASSSLPADVKILLLTIYCSEGDNVPEALEISTVLNSLEKLVEVNNGRCAFKYPVSWSRLFGNGPLASLY